MASYTILNYPLVVLVISIAALWGSAWLGMTLCRGKLEQVERDDFGIILGASLTLLGLIIGFSFSMATSRYDQRKLYEEAEANAIGTELVRAQLMPGPAATNVAELLTSYLNDRVTFYQAPGDERDLDQIEEQTGALRGSLWSAVRGPALAAPTPLNALVLSGMNDVLNSQDSTEAAWRNRIPIAAWSLMAIIAIVANMLVGYGSHPAKGRYLFLLIVPVLASIAFMLIADLDSPRGGIIRVSPENLIALSQSLHRPSP